MIRKFIKLSELEYYDEMHQLQPDGSFTVDEAKDGQSTEKHIEGIEYVKKVLLEGKKTMPILVYERDEGGYVRLDGFKRTLAFKELGHTTIEAFVCTEQEFTEQRRVPFLNSELLCYKGGQFKEEYKLFEGNTEKEQILYWNNDVEGLRIEAAENVQIHWGRYGKYRLALGRRDFLELATAIASIPDGSN